MWVFRRSILQDMKLEADGMAFSEEIKIEALRHPRIRFGEISILYSTRLGEKKLNPWRDGVQNLVFLARKRFFREGISYRLSAVSYQPDRQADADRGNRNSLARYVTTEPQRNRETLRASWPRQEPVARLSVF